MLPFYVFSLFGRNKSQIEYVIFENKTSFVCFQSCQDAERTQIYKGEVGNSIPSMSGHLDGYHSMSQII